MDSYSSVNQVMRWDSRTVLEHGWDESHRPIPSVTQERTRRRERPQLEGMSDPTSIFPWSQEEALEERRATE